MADESTANADALLDRVLELDRLGRSEAAGRALLRLADENVPGANSLLGAWLLTGRTWKADVGEGVSRLLRASAQGDAAAMACLAALHAAGLFVRQDLGRAMDHLLDAALRGSHGSITQLALLLPAEASTLRARLLFDAATRGDANAQYFLGLDLSKHPAEAARDGAGLWWSIAAAAGHPLACTRSEPFRGALTLPPTPALPAVFWNDVHTALGRREWQSPAASTAASTSGPLEVTAQMIESDWCDYLVGNHGMQLEAAEVNLPDGSSQRHAMRSNSLSQISLGRLDILSALTWARVAAHCGVEVPDCEWPNLLRYLPGQQYDDHFDFIDPEISAFRPELDARGQRIRTMLLYLNDDYEGGTTDFPTLGLSHQGQRGELLHFANVLGEGHPDRRMLHAGRPCTRGTKWLMSIWVRDRAQHG